MAADGRSLVTAVGLRQRSIGLQNGRNHRQISLEGYAFNPKFTRDGTRIFYQRYKSESSLDGPSELWIAEADTGRSQLLFTGVASAGTGGGSGGGGSGSGSGDGSGSGSGSGSASGGGDTSAGSGAAGGGTSDGDGKNGSSSGEQVPAGSSLPNCTAGAVKLTVRSVRNAYAPGVNPTFELIARNSSGGDCKLDLGPDNTVVTITPADADDDDAFWASDDCHETAGSLMFKVPAGDRVTYTVEWNRDPSAPNCATPSPGSATAGTYLVEAKAPGLATARTSFVLEKD